jgi:hypothetical protein
MSDVRLLSHKYNFGVNTGYLYYIVGYIIFGQVPCTYKGSKKYKYFLRDYRLKTNSVKSLSVKNVSTVVKNQNNKVWEKRSTSLIPAIMILLPLLLAATTNSSTTTTTNNSKNHCGFWLLPLYVDDSLQSPTNLHALSRPERHQFDTNKEPLMKCSHTRPLSRIRATYGYH